MAGSEGEAHDTAAAPGDSTGRTPILSLQPEALAEWFVKEGQRPYRASQVRGWIFRRRAADFEGMSDLPARLRRRLAEQFTVFGSRVRAVRVAQDGTRKLLLQLADGQQVEAVLMRQQTRRTVCVSTQVGCAMGCTFCASGLAGLVRNLAAWEIVEQFLLARNCLPVGQELAHAVIMGMGEPLANLTNVLAALDVVCSKQGLNLGQRRVTISTVGLPAAMRRLADQGRGYHLAVSLHAADDELRSRLVPANATTGVRAIVAAADYFWQQTGRQVTYEYVLLAGINDSPIHARRLGELLAGRKVYVNLIAYNEVEGLGLRRPSRQRVREFADRLAAFGLCVKARRSKGERIRAACGQLRLAAALKP